MTAFTAQLPVLIFALYPLNVNVNSFWTGSRHSRTDILFLIIIVAVIFIVLLLINIYKGRNNVSSGAFSGLSYYFKSKKLLKNVGLTGEQKKMLKFVFKNDSVSDIEKSLYTTSLLDRHFMNAYNTIIKKTASAGEVQNKLAILFSTRNKLDYKIAENITSTTELKDNVKITITSSKNKYTLPLISARGEQLALEAPKNALGSPVKFKDGEKINAVFFTRDDKGFSFETRTMGYSASLGHTTLLLAHSNKLKFLSQRRCRRKETNIPCNMRIVNTEGKGKKQKLIVDKRIFSGTIADISVGGCSIKTKSPLRTDIKLKIEISGGNLSIAALGQVLRTNRNGMITVLHIRFLRVSKKSMNQINAFVYEYKNE